MTTPASSALPETSPQIGARSSATSTAEITEKLTELARQYPTGLIEIELEDVPRTAYNIALSLGHAPADPVICDVGGGMCMFSLGCAALGYRAILIDDFGDELHLRFADSALGLHNRYGVQIISADVIAKGVDLEPETIDVATCFHTMEHFHHSPKRLFRQIVAALRPGGIFVLGVPNRVNLRKRVMVPFGGAPWTSIESWYEPEVFRSHVREPDVPDLHYICRDLSLDVMEVAGRNWQGHKNKRPLIRLLARCADRTLQSFPSLCSDIYIVGKKPGKK